MTMTEQDEISAFFAADPDVIAWPYPMYERWQAGSGIVRWDRGPATLLTRHRDVKGVWWDERVLGAKVSLLRWSSSSDPFCPDLFGAHLHTPLAQGELSAERSGAT
jgi:hypothetical protein